MQLVDIAFYPIKSARGHPVRAAAVEARGLRGDRRWIITDARNRVVTQRELPALARLQADPAGDPAAPSLRLSFDGSCFDVEGPDAHAQRHPVTIWGDTLPLPEAAGAGEWLTGIFGRELRLFHQADDVHRPVGAWARAEDEVSLADAFPILLTSTASLAALSRAAGIAYDMERFRPNLIVDTAEAWAEDGWETIRVGEVVFDLPKPCARCATVTVDQALGKVSGDPLATLRAIRMSGDRRVPGVLFGWNAVPRSFGTIRAGDRVEVLAERPPWPILPARSRAPDPVGLG